MVRAKQDNLIADAAQASEEGDPQEAGVPFTPVFLGPESRGINQEGDDPGFKTRVKPPSSSSRAAKTAEEKPPAKKAVGRPRGSAADRSIADISQTLEEKFALIFGLLTSALPVTGTYGVENAPKAVRALLDIGKRRPAVMKALLRIADGADGLEIGKFVLGLAVALQVDMGRIPGDSVPARATGVTEIIEKYFIEEEGSATNDRVTEQAVGSRFQPVA